MTTPDQKQPVHLDRYEVSLVQWEARRILQALRELDARWDAICAETEDEDEAAEIGNDLIELRQLYERLQRGAVERFGLGVLNVSRDPI